MDRKQEMKRLQNGSDIRGVAVEGIPGETVTLNEAAANCISQAFVWWYCKKANKQPCEVTVGVGRDSRISGKALADAVLEGILSTGAKAADCGYASTPSMFMSIIYPETDFDAAVMVTASHLPYNRNGMKFFDAGGGLEKTDITEILTLAAQISTARPDAGQKAFPVDLIGRYAEDLREKIKERVQAGDYEKPLAGLHIVVDAGNGVGGFFAEKILAPLGADISGSQYLEPDGMFPNHIPNPEDKEAMASIQKATVGNQADLGLIFDTDVDRASAVGASGREINRDGIIALMSAILAPEYPGSTIVTDSVTSDRLTDFLENELGLVHFRYMRGYKNVINKCRELNENGTVCPLAMETSGHGAMKENYYLDDGAYQAVRLVCAAAKAKQDGRQIEELIQNMSEEFADKELRIRIEEEDFKAYGAKVLEQFRTRAEESGCRIVQSYEGIRVSVHNKEAHGWMLLRASLHDPVLVLNLEGRTKEDLRRLEEMAQTFLESK